MKQQYNTLTFGQFFPVVSDQIFVAVSGVFLREYTSIQFSSEADKDFNRSENQFNVGVGLSLFWEYEFSNF